MRLFHALTLTSLSWIAACTANTDPELCGDDAYYAAGVDIVLSGAVEDQTYTVDVDADGVVFQLVQPPGGSDSFEATFDDGTLFDASLRWSENYPPDPNASVLSILLHQPPDESAWGPETVHLTVEMGGETVEETVTPTYDRVDRWGPTCRGTEHATVEINVPTT